MASKRFRLMRSELNRLRRVLVPKLQKGEILNLTPRLSIRALSYRVLSHAEIEQYLEDRADEVARAADASWKDRRHVSETTLCLLAFSGQQLARVPSTLKPPPNKQQDWSELVKPDKRLSHAITQFTRYARRENHGIKEENALALLLPIGLRADEIDELLLAEMNDFGTKRGSAAHASVAGHVTAGVNPFDEVAQVGRILEGLEIVDQKLDRLLAEAK